jgi:mannonate dehydratase
MHEIPTGDVWPEADVKARHKQIQEAGLTWNVVESIPLHNDIKTRSGDYRQLIENYKESIKSVGKAGIPAVCYNFMPVVDWTRTNLSYRVSNSAQALRFELTDFAAYDVYILQREGAQQDYTPEVLAKAKVSYNAMSEEQQLLLEKNIIAGLPGGEGSYTRESIKVAIAQFIELGTEGMRTNLIEFLKAVVPVAEEYGVKLCIHPDDPPFSLFGLPRVVSTADDARKILRAVDSPANGITLCAGSYGARCDNDLVAMAEEFASRIYFVHLRNVKREEDGSFYESDHLDGDNDMVGLINALLKEERRRQQAGEAMASIPMRPDHGHLMADEEKAEGVKPGYSYSGRLRGLAELRGVIHALSHLH